MRMRLFGAAAAVALLPIQAAPLGAQEEPVSIGVRTTIRSEILGEAREILVATPADYATGRSHYPVLYLLDGDAHFLQAVASVRFLAGQGMAPGVIVVAISNTDRGRDLTPPTSTAADARDFPTAGGAARFRQFLVDELRPFIEGRYRTEPYRILVGWSLGGLFAVRTLLEEPAAFDAYVAVSPSLWWDGEADAALADSMFTRGVSLPKFLYLTHGREDNSIPKSVQAFTTVLGRKAPRDLRWTFAYLPNDNHGSSPARAIHDGLERLFEGWALAEERVPTVAELEQRYGSLTERFGFPCRPDEGRLNGLGYAALRRGRLAAATELFEYVVRVYPESPNAYDSLADAQEAAGRLDLALASCRTACRLAEEQQDARLALFREHLQRVASKLAPPG